MESVSVKNTIFATIRRNPLNPVSRIHLRRRVVQGKTSNFLSRVIHCKKYDFQDFQGYAKPVRLFPATEVKVCKESSQEKNFPFISEGSSQSFFKVKLQTSNMSGSSLSDLNAGVLLCLIDENGDSILQRIPASLMTDHSSELDNADPERLSFQRGSVDEFTFQGPKLAKIEALWISLESGQWRLGRLHLTVLDALQTFTEENDLEDFHYIGCRYDFEADDILLGEGGNMPLVELRPSLVTEVSGVDPFTMLSKSMSSSASPLHGGVLNEESMKEYTDLKFSLLLYDAILIFVGTSIASILVGEGSGITFLVGGVSGFLYLLLLQRSVDGLEVPTLIPSSKWNTNQVTGGFKGPLTSLALAIGLSAITVKYGTGDVPFILTPKDLLAGMMGFLACKVAVVLAAFKPIPVRVKENK